MDEYQLLEARAYGADTVLLIVAILEIGRLSGLITASRKLGMEPLVEVCNRSVCLCAPSRRSISATDDSMSADFFNIKNVRGL